MTLCIAGYSTTIVDALLPMLPASERMVKVGRGPDADVPMNFDTMDAAEAGQIANVRADRFVFALGLLRERCISEQTGEEIVEGLAVNLVSVILAIEAILKGNENARIVVVGSESGEKGSFDTTYFLAKAALHTYVRERALSFPRQQLVCIAPSVILDSRMTQGRRDLEDVLARTASLPKQRYLSAREVASLIRFLLYEDEGYISNEVISINGGKFARMT